MSNQPKYKFTKVNLKLSLAYRERESACQKLAPSNPRLAKELQIEKGVKTTLQIEWDKKVNNLILRK